MQLFIYSHSIWQNYGADKGRLQSTFHILSFLFVELHEKI